VLESFLKGEWGKKENNGVDEPNWDKTAKPSI
jgi:hypothetical protein